MLAVVGVVVLGGAAWGLWHSWRVGWLTHAHFAALRSCPDDAEPSHRVERADTPAVRLVPRAERLLSPTSLAFHPTLELVYVSQQRGAIRTLTDGRLDDRPVLDLTGRVTTLFDQGLLALAVDPAGRHLYAYFTDEEGDSTLVAWPLDDRGRPDEAGERLILHQAQDDVYHNGGGLQFDARGDLYLTMGDGGLLGDWRNRAQRLDVLLGKIVRIRPTPEADEAYEVPDDNPWVGFPSAAPEAWARGTRNPYRLDIDPDTGDVWVADVGLRCAEEVTRIADGRSGANLGWHHREGGLDFVGGGPPDLLDPVFWYPHDPGCAVIGGAVYRGRRLPELAGSYVVSDYCTGRLVALTPTEAGGTGEVTARDLGVESLAPLGIFRAPDGELWLTNQSDEVLELRPVGPPDPSDAAARVAG
jgi:glucose/arabinose dehydrogenase